ncbi:MAG TPA: hypothetical protein VGG71_08420 [Chitinophagaceae bacterium]
MKKKLTVLFAATTLLISTAFAHVNFKPSKEVQNEFNRLFTHPTEIKWEEVSNFDKVTFNEGGQYLTAFFNPTGKIESVSRNIGTATLPLILQKELQNKLSASWVADCFELYGKNGTEYYITVESANNSIVYRSNSNDWDIYKKTKK